jgi:hypothetical protein
MAVYIFDKDALDKMALVEGMTWKEQEESNPDQNCSFQAFLSAWNRDFAGKEELIREGSSLNCFISVNASGAIYGKEGYNRYAVRVDGRIFFMRDMSIKEDIEKATLAGFDMM